MNYTKKMALVDPRMIQHMQSQAHVTENPTETKMCQLDQDMQAILNQHDLPTKQKMVLYNEVLQKYLFFQDKLSKETPGQTPSPEKVVIPETTEGAIDLPKEDMATQFSIIDSTPKPYRNKARVFLNYLERNKNVSWSKNGELVYKGRTVPHTHVVDLIQDSLRKRKTHVPHGWQQFAYILKESNVPRDLIGNSDRWDWIQKESSEFTFPTTSPKPERSRSVKTSSTKPLTGKFRWTPY